MSEAIREVERDIENLHGDIANEWDGERVDVLMAKKARLESKLARLVVEEDMAHRNVHCSGFKFGPGRLTFRGENVQGVDISESLIQTKDCLVVDVERLPPDTKYLRIWSR